MQEKCDGRGLAFLPECHCTMAKVPDLGRAACAVGHRAKLGLAGIQLLTHLHMLGRAFGAFWFGKNSKLMGKLAFWAMQRLLSTPALWPGR